MQHKGEYMANINSALILQRMVFDKIVFERIGFKNEKELKFDLQVQIGTNEEKIYKVTLVLNGNKQEEYNLSISLSGYFTIDTTENLEDKFIQDLINRNAVAILMPYLRSELTLLTAQPEMESVVLPPFNINKMLEQAE